MHVGRAEASRFTVLLRKGLDHPNSGDGVGQNVGDFCPNAVNPFKAGAQLFANNVDQPGNDWQREQGHYRQGGVDRHQNGCGHRDHQHVGDEIEEVQRNEQIDTVGF